MPAGRPTKYKPEYCEALVAHMKQGFSFESFSADCDVSIQTIYDWLDAHPEFLEAKKKGESFGMKLYERMALTAMSGNLKRLAKETPIMITNEKGLKVAATDPNTGEVLYEREWQSVQWNPVTWIFIVRNRYPKYYRDTRHIALSGDGEGGPIKVKKELSPAEKLQEARKIAEIMRELEEANARIGKPIDESKRILLGGVPKKREG